MLVIFIDSNFKIEVLVASARTGCSPGASRVSGHDLSKSMIREAMYYRYRNADGPGIDVLN